MFIGRRKLVRDLKGVKISYDILSIKLIAHFNMFDRMTIVGIVVDNGFNKALRFFH